MRFFLKKTLHSNFILKSHTLLHGCSPVKLLYICRKPFASKGLLLKDHKKTESRSFLADILLKTFKENPLWFHELFHVILVIRHKS